MTGGFNVGKKTQVVSLPCLLFVALVVMFAVPQPSMAQVLYGSILGDVKDSSGAFIQGAAIVVTNKNTGLTRQGSTDAAGRFNFADLPAGVYIFKASQMGFKNFEQTEVTVNINSVTRVDVTLEIGSMDDTVTVSAEPPMLQTDTAEVHVNLTGAELTNLPVPLGRNYQQVYRMLPGFAPLSTRTQSPPTRHGRWSSRSTGRATTRTTRASTGSVPPTSSCRTSSPIFRRSFQEVNVVTTTPRPSARRRVCP